ncbi:MAG: phospholipase D-like domain-containing protein [Halofilum sp. (in: g-proteobacteria)]|nr:phospholipase D-like domain-containing protein [Halofilum sp. (in: g-proteobacteria)]
MRAPIAQPTPPWRDGNRFEVLVDGHRYFPAMARAIATAQARVALEMYLVQPGALTTLFVEALCDAARRGVVVHLLVDGFGARGLGRRERDRLLGAGVHFARFNVLSPLKLSWNLVRDHRKLLLVDERMAFLGGAGLSDAFDTRQGRGWRDNMLRIEGDCVGDWWAVFAANWQRCSRVPCHVPVTAPAGDSRGRALAGSLAGARVIKAAAINDIRRARRRVWLASPYFLPPWKLRRALSRAARRGCDVRLLLPGPRTDHGFVRAASHRLYGWLLKRGVRVFEYQPAFMHAKALLADERVMLGSCNFDRWSLRWNLEANQQVDDAAVAARLATVLAADLAASVEITRAQWERRPLRERLRERLWAWLEALAVRASSRGIVHDEARRRGDPRRPR